MKSSHPVAFRAVLSTPARLLGLIGWTMGPGDDWGMQLGASYSNMDRFAVRADAGKY